jgi:hypothetical protein
LLPPKPTLPLPPEPKLPPLLPLLLPKPPPLSFEPKALPFVVGPAFGVDWGAKPPWFPNWPSSQPRMTDRPRSSRSIVRSSNVGC